MLGSGAAVGPFRVWENGGALGACSQLHRLPGGRDPAQHSDSGQLLIPPPQADARPSQAWLKAQESPLRLL